MPRARCAPSPVGGRSAALAEASAGVARWARADTSAAAMHALGLVDLRSSPGVPAAVDLAVVSLTRAVRRAPGEAAALNDLAVAYLALAERDQQLRPLLQALDAVERARRLAPREPAVLFNRALVLERAYLTETARGAWADYLATERDPAWRGEGAAHLRHLASNAVAPPRARDSLLALTLGARRAELATRVARAPQWAREAGFEQVETWARATVRRDTQPATRALDLARALGAVLDTVGGDRSVPLLVAAIDAATPGRRVALARAHVDLADGYAHYEGADYDAAERRLGRAERVLRALDSPAARWAALYRAAATLNRGDHDAADRVLRAVAASAEPGEHLLRGKAIWALGVSQVRRGAYEAATRLYAQATPHVARSREAENYGMLMSLRTEALELAGQSAAGREEALRALRALAPFGGSRYRGNHLEFVASYARADGLDHAALAVTSEQLAAAAPTGRPPAMARGHGLRARALIALGDLDGARAELAASARWIARIASGSGRDEVAADVALLRGELSRRADPRRAHDEMRAVVGAYRAGRQESKLPNALHALALAARDAGDAAAARRALAEAVERVEGRRGLFPTAEVRATFYETTEGVFDALMGLELDAGRPAAAFQYLERARAAAWRSGGGRAAAAPSLDALRADTPRGTLLVVYAVLADRLVVWTVRHDRVGHHVLPVGREAVAELVARFDEEASAVEPAASGAPARLFDLLLRPVDAELRDATTLVVVPDRELSRIPFAALWDGAARRYVVESHTVRTVPSAAFLRATTAAPRLAGARDAALVVGDPAFDSLAVPHLPRLPGAAGEARRVAGLYGGRRRVLTGVDVRRDSVLALLRTHAVVHFAGHAVPNVDQPELSFLTLAADRSVEGGILRAREIVGLRLSTLRIVVLSACRTLGARPTHVGALAGLAYSFLRAGVPATVSSLWDVDDGTTTPLLVSFHRHLTAGVPAADALRAAQLEALRAPDAVRRAPRVWAAFVYTGP